MRIVRPPNFRFAFLSPNLLVIFLILFCRYVTSPGYVEVCCATIFIYFFQLFSFFFLCCLFFLNSVLKNFRFQILFLNFLLSPTLKTH